MKKPFYVKIMRASRSSYWYANRIGEEFLVIGIESPDEDIEEAMFVVKPSDHSLDAYVRWDDCEVISAAEHDMQMDDTV